MLLKVILSDLRTSRTEPPMGEEPSAGGVKMGDSSIRLSTPGDAEAEPDMCSNGVELPGK